MRIPLVLNLIFWPEMVDAKFFVGNTVFTSLSLILISFSNKFSYDMPTWSPSHIVDCFY